MRILVTGIAGFIGSNLAERLLREGKNAESKFGRGKLEVVGIDNLTYGVKEQVPDGVEFHQLDIRSKEIFSLFKDVDFVFHLAAKNCISDCQKDPVETADINVTGTVNVFEAARKAGVKKVIYAESSAMYENSEIFPTPESEVRPVSFYAISKFASRHFAEAFGRFSDLRFTALRYFCVYGPRQDYRRTIPPVMSSFIIKLLKGESPIIYGTGEKKRDFVYIDDVNDFHLQCLTDNRTDEKVFNLGSGKSHSVNDIYRIISDFLDIHICPIHQQDLPGEAKETLADISRASQLGWWPKVDIHDGLKQMVDYIQSEIKKGNIR